MEATDEDIQCQPITVNVHGDNNLVVVGGRQSRIVINRGKSYSKDSEEDTGITK